MYDYTKELPPEVKELGRACLDQWAEVLLVFVGGVVAITLIPDHPNEPTKTSDRVLEEIQTVLAEGRTLFAPDLDVVTL